LEFQIFFPLFGEARKEEQAQDWKKNILKEKRFFSVAITMSLKRLSHYKKYFKVNGQPLRSTSQLQSPCPLRDSGSSGASRKIVKNFSTSSWDLRLGIIGSRSTSQLQSPCPLRDSGSSEASRKIVKNFSTSSCDLGCFSYSWQTFSASPWSVYCFLLNQSWYTILWGIWGICCRMQSGLDGLIERWMVVRLEEKNEAHQLKVLGEAMMVWAIDKNWKSSSALPPRIFAP
jgi:hypothetical protein